MASSDGESQEMDRFDPSDSSNSSDSLSVDTNQSDCRPEDAKSADVEQETSSEESNHGCDHYRRRCAYVAPCCRKVYSCRFCHDAEEKDHKINRFDVMEIECLLCNTRQLVDHNCVSCGVEFGRYFCAKCRLFDDNDKKQFHCDQCGLCRVGGRENFFHCPKCDMCLSKDLEDSHPCVEKVSHDNCPVCMEDLHTSVDTLSVLKCGHMTHHKCFQGLLSSGNYYCPLCCQTMLDMKSTWTRLDVEIANTPMPEEYRNKRVTILCRDCHKECNTLFHVFGLKCKKCGSYNTCRAPDSASETGEEEDDDSNAPLAAAAAALADAAGDYDHDYNDDGQMAEHSSGTEGSSSPSSSNSSESDRDLPM